jgi:hypothetical protein
MYAIPDMCDECRNGWNLWFMFVVTFTDFIRNI